MAYRNQPGRTYRRGDARTTKDQVDHMLRSLGERVVMAAEEASQGAGRLGNRLLDMDDAYAAAVSKAAPNAPMQAMSGTSLRQLGSNYRDNGIYSNTGNLQEDLLFNAVHNGGALANVASRYALPAGGVTLAGKGLMDIAAGLSPEEEENLMIRYS